MTGVSRLLEICIWDAFDPQAGLWTFLIWRNRDQNEKQKTRTGKVRANKKYTNHLGKGEKEIKISNTQVKKKTNYSVSSAHHQISEFIVYMSWCPLSTSKVLNYHVDFSLKKHRSHISNVNATTIGATLFTKNRKLTVC